MPELNFTTNDLLVKIGLLVVQNDALAVELGKRDKIISDQQALLKEEAGELPLSDVKK